MATDGRRPRVVVVGSGFGGLAAVRALRDEPVDVVLVDRTNYHLFQPLLYQVATAGLEASDVAYPVRGILWRQRNARFRSGEVTGVDLDRRVVCFADGATLPYDHLVLAAGARSTSFGVEGVDEHAFPLKSVRDAMALRTHLLAQFEQADDDPSLVRAGALNVVVVGGGPTGVEMAGAVSELYTKVLARDFPDLDLTLARVVVVEMVDALLTSFHPRLQAHAARSLRARGVELLLGTGVARVTREGVELSDGRHVPTRTVVWAAGVRAAALADALGLEQTRGGRVVVGPDLSVPGHPEVWVVGDLAGARDAQGALHPQLAPVAQQGARHVARQIRHRLRGRPAEPFRYVDKGTMATIGRRSAVAQLPLGLRFTGTLAWMLWLFLHLVTLIGFRNRLSVLVNWFWNYLTWDRGARLVTDPEADAGPPSATAPW